MNKCVLGHDPNIEIETVEPESWHVSMHDEIQCCKYLLTKLESSPRQMAIAKVRHYINDYLAYYLLYFCEFLKYEIDRCFEFLC